MIRRARVALSLFFLVGLFSVAAQAQVPLQIHYLFLQNGIGLAGEGYLRNVPAPWTIVGTGDYDGDGKADILWRNTVTGDDYLFLMNGLNVTGEGYLPSVPTDWAVQGN